MAITPDQCEQHLNSLPPQAQARFLARLGHQLTIVAREAYEFQGPGVNNPRWLRDINEICHRLFSQIAALAVEQPALFPNDIIVSWITAEGKPNLQPSCLDAFEYIYTHEPRV